MQQLVSFIEKNKYVLLFLFLEFLAFSLTFQSKSYHKSQLVNSTNAVTGFFFKNYNAFFALSSLKIENDRLQSENTYLRNVLDVKSEEIPLVKIDSNLQKNHYIAAKVIRNNYTHRNNILTLDKGRKDGLRTDMGVVNGESIIGIVNNVSENYATVLSVLHSQSKINIRLKNSFYLGSLAWNGKDYKTAQVHDLQRQAPLSIGDSVVSGGKSALFPEEILIGTVLSFDAGPKKYDNIQIELATDMSNIGHVYVIKNLDKTEREQLEIDP